MGDEVRNGTGRFEPPPWELEAFEALARKRAEDQAALEMSEATVVPSETKSGQSAEPEAPEEQVAGKTAAQLLDERQVQAMLMQLSNEETESTGSIKLVARIAAIITAFVGIGMIFGGMTTIKTANKTSAGVMGSAALSVFGLCFVAMAVWVWVGSNRTKRSR
jgi:hypothetical protein